MKAILFVAAIIMMAFPVQKISAEPAGIAQAPDSSHQFLVLLRQSPPRFGGEGGYGRSYNNAKNQAAREKIGRKLAKEYGVKFVGFWPMPLLGLDCLIMEAAEGQSAATAIQRVGGDRRVEWAQPMNVYSPNQARPTYNDPLFTVSPAAHQWRLADLHRVSTGKGVTIAIVDSRIDDKHPDLAGRMKMSRDFVAKGNPAPETHGTGVAGVIAAKPNNSIGIVGVAPDAQLIGLRACWQQSGGGVSLCDSVSLAKSLHFAVENKVDIVNLSLSGPRDRLLASLIDVGRARGIFFVASVDPEREKGGFPASHKSVIAISDTPSVALLFGGYSAPGRGIPTTRPGGSWYLVDGSSYAAAHVSGLIALIKQRIDIKPREEQLFVLQPNSESIIDARATLLQKK